MPTADYSGGCLSARRYASRTKRIHDVEKPKAMEIGITRANLPHAMLAHQDCSMRIMDQISAELRNLTNDVGCDVGMAQCGDQNIKARRRQQRYDETPRSVGCPWSPHYARMRRHTQEFIQ